MALINSLASIIGGSSTVTPRALAGIYELDPQRSVDSDQAESFRSFQYFPETISESRNVPLQSKEPLGGSHPIYQWVTPGDRKISFRAFFSSDSPKESSTNNSAPSGDFLSQALGKASQISGFLKNPVSSVVNSGKPLDPADGKYTADVAAAIGWLRAKTYPAYRAGGRVLPPPKLVLVLQNSGISFGQSIAGYSDFNSVTCLMESISVEYQSFFPNGNIRYAEVSLSFVEIIQVGEKWRYINRDELTSHWQGGYLNGKGALGNNSGATETKSQAKNLEDQVKSAIPSTFRKIFPG